MKRKAPEKPKRPVKPVFHAVQDHEIQLDADRWSGFRDSFGEREVGIDADGSPIELLRLVREFTPVEQAIADRVSRLAAADLPGIAKALRLEHDEQKRRPRLVLVSERIAGIRLSEAIVRGISRAVVPDIGAALYVMRRLFTTAESLHAATGSPHLIIAPERVILTPRADVVLTEAALGGATEALIVLPKALRLALSDVSGQAEGHRVDIARIARIGMSMMLGRLLDPHETVDALSPALNEIAEVASIRANEVFATALRTWIEHAVTIDADVSFKSFRQAGEALVLTEPPKGCAASRRTLKTFLNDLALEDFRSPDMVALEAERIHAIRARQTGSRPIETARNVWDALAPELGLAPKDEILQESLEEIESKPLNPPAEERPETEEEEEGADEIDMSEALAEIGVEPEAAMAAVDEAGVFEIGEPVGDLSFESFDLASVPASRAIEEAPPEPPPPLPVQIVPPPAAPEADVVLRAVASRFGFLLREEPGKRKPIVDPTARVAIPDATPVAVEAKAVPLSVAEPLETPLAVEATTIEEPAIQPTPVEQPVHVAATPDVQDASPVAPAEPEYGEPEYREPEPSQEPVAPDEDQEPWTPPLVVIAEPPPHKRQKRSWFRAVADQFGMGDQPEVTEAPATDPSADAAIAEGAAAEEAQWFADAESEHANEAVTRHASEALVAADADARRLLSDLEARRTAEAEIRRAADEDARRVGEAAARGAAQAEAQRLAEDDGRRLAEAQARAEARRLVAEEEAQTQAAELHERVQAAEAEARRVAEEENRQLMAEAEERRQAEENARHLAAEADARRRAEDEARRHAEAEARQRAEEEARTLAEAEARRLAAVAEARRLEKEEAERRAAAEARQRAEEEARRRAEEEARRLAAEAEARRRAEEEAKRRAEAEARERAEQEAARRAEEEARRVAAEIEARRREAEARQRAEQETRKRAEDQARHVAAEAEVRRLASIAETETRRLEAENAARRAAAQAEAQRVAAAAAQQRADESEKIEAAELVEAESRTAWVNSMASEMGLKDKTPAQSDSSWAPTPMPGSAEGMLPPAEPPPFDAEWHPSAPATSAAWETPSPAPAAQIQEAWQRSDGASTHPPAGDSWRTDPIQAIEPAAAYEPIRKPARESKGPSRLPEIAAAVSQMLRSAALLIVAAGLVGGLSWAGYSYYSSKFVPGTVVIESTPTAAEILIDGAAKGVTPLTIELPPGKHKLELRRRGNSREITLDIAAGEQLRQQIDLTNLRAIGILVVNSSPKGATVSIDGRERGVTPLTLNDVDAGAHSVLIESTAGSIQKNVQIVAGGKVTLDEGIFSGWIAVFAPFELKIFERKRLVGTTDNDRIMLSAGRHELEFVNTQRGFSDTRVVEVGPGATVPVNVLESETEGIVRIDAPAGTELFIDGKPVGESPIGEQHVSVGAREILAKHPQFGEKKTSATVNSSRPVDVKIEFASQP